jgi:large subunit ribosomal protein L10
MAITKDKKQAQVAELVALFNSAKVAITAKYTGLSVQDVQDLRKVARENGVVIRVVKNRLVKVALKESRGYKDADNSSLTDQLLYAFSSEDEVAPAQVLAKFAKSHGDLKLVSGFSEGNAMDTSTVTMLASLPSKDQLRGQLVSVIAAPLSQFLNVANGTQRGLAQVLAQRAEAL